MRNNTTAKSRYCFYPAVTGRVGRRVTLLDRIRRRRALRRMATPDVFPVCGYNAPIYPGK